MFDSPEACADEALMNPEEIAPDGYIFVGVATPCVPRIDAFAMLERLEYDLSDAYGDAAYDYYAFNYSTDKEKVRALEDELNEIVVRWLKENGRYPTGVYSVSQIRPFDVADYLKRKSADGKQEDSYEP